MARKILVVEDNEINRKLFVSLLREKGYETCEAENGLDALAMIEREAPSLVLLDIILPQMDGYEVFRTSREKGLLHNTRVYALTAADEGDIHDAGFDGIITKPVRVAEFMRTVEKALEADNS